MIDKLCPLKRRLPIINGIFNHIDYQFWDFTADELDVIFMSKYSHRISAPIIETVKEVIDDESITEVQSLLTDSQLTYLGQLILKMFKPKWDRLKDIPFLEYDILNNYLDIYQEVQKDNNVTALKSNKVTDSTQDNISSNSTASEFSGNIINENTSNMTSERTDNFDGTFSRTTDTEKTRTDDLTEYNAERENNVNAVTNTGTNGKTINERTSNVRTDDLVEHQANSGTKEQAISQLTANEQSQLITDDEKVVHDNIVEEGSGNSSGIDSIYGFNSSTAVPADTTSNNNTNEKSIERVTTTDGHESLTETKDVISQLTDTAETDKNVSSKTNEGTQSEEGTKTTTISLNNSGTNSTVGDKRLTAETVNTGTQATVETGTVTDTTHNEDEQSSESTISSEGNTSNINATKSSLISSDKITTLNKMEDNKVVSEALDRARETMHRGNLGNVTPQELIRQEIDLWRWNFINEVMEDVKTFVSLALYN